MFLSRNGSFVCFLALSVSLMLIGSVRECASEGEQDVPPAASPEVVDGTSSGDKEGEGTTRNHPASTAAEDTSQGDAKSDEWIKDGGHGDKVDGTTETQAKAKREREEVTDSDSEENGAVEDKLSEEQLESKRPTGGKDRSMPKKKEPKKKEPKKKEPKKKKDISAEKIQKAKTLFADIDANHDGNVTGGEIHQWVDRTKEKAIEDQLAADWSASNTDGDDAVSWQEYKVGVVQRAGLSFDDEEDQKMITNLIAVEWGRFEAADRDKNATLSKEEFKAAIFPHLYTYMLDQMVQEMLKELDKNSDELVTLQEYREMFAELMGAQEPGVFNAFEEQIASFHKEHDKNGDGLLDTVELRPMVVQDTSNHSAEETDRLLSMSDTNENGDLDFEEFLSNYKEFKMSLESNEYRPFMVEDEEFDDDDDDDDDGNPFMPELNFNLDDDDDDDDDDDSDDGDYDEFFHFDEEKILRELKDEL